MMNLLPSLLPTYLHGIPQGSRLFYEIFQQKMNYLPSKADKCLFINTSIQERAAVLIWVDDFIFMSEKMETWEKFLMRLRQRFTIPNVGPLQCFSCLSLNPCALWGPEGAKRMISRTPNAVLGKKPALARARQEEASVTITCKHGIRSPTQTDLTEKGVEIAYFERKPSFCRRSIPDQVVTSRDIASQGGPSSVDCTRL